MLPSPETDVKTIENLDPKNYIIIKNARLNNLKNLDIAFKRNALTVVTGLSGSGKSTLVFDTLYAEGQRRYVESLSAYARQFLSRMKKPEVDYIKGLAPAIAIEQKVVSRNPRSTVGTSTEIYDYLKLLFARVGTTISPISGQVVTKHTVTDVINYITSLPTNAKIEIGAPLAFKESWQETTKICEIKGIVRIKHQGVTSDVSEITPNTFAKSYNQSEPFYAIIDRYMVPETIDEEQQNRLADSVQSAFFEGHGNCVVWHNNVPTFFNDKFEADGISFEEPNINFFSFSNPYGACKTCEGFGNTIGIDPDLVIPDQNLSVFEGAIAPWKTEKWQSFQQKLIKNGIKFDFPIHRPWCDLSPEEQNLIWQGNTYFEGLNHFFAQLERESHLIQNRVMLSRFRGRTLCPDCKGTRLRKDTQYVKLIDINTNEQFTLADLVLMPIDELKATFDCLQLSTYQMKVASRLWKEVNNRLQFLCDVGLSYLTLNRLSASLSGGEAQRIRLATSLGSSLVGSLYILDEPSIGLHPHDSAKLIGVLKQLRDLGNTVIVVEHEEGVMQAADELIDIGPEAGIKGGKLMFQGNMEALLTSNTLTAQYLNQKLQIAVPKNRRKAQAFIHFEGIKEHNLQNIAVSLPINTLIAVSGVSGSGKTTLIKKVVYPALQKMLAGFGEKPGQYSQLYGDFKNLKTIELIDQNPIGKSTRSNPVTYTKAYDHIRVLFAEQGLSKAQGFKPSHFSFNVEGGRCETCQGEGFVNIEMQFLADVQLLCESCKGKRFKDEVLEVTYNGLNIYDILELTVAESLSFFNDQKNILNRLQPLADVGLDYVKLGQPSATLSGGEAQRIKLASYLTKGSQAENGLFIFDEPTTGLHFHDIAKLMVALQALVNQGNTVIVIEHNTDVIKCADWVIDLGPGGGKHGGKVVFAGTPEALIQCQDSVTAQYLKNKLN